MEEEKIEKKEPYGILFGILAYNNIEEYKTYINRLENESVNDILLTVNAALRFGQAKGIYSLEESEAMSLTLRKLNGMMKNRKDS